MSRSQCNLLALRELTYLIADELDGKANIEHIILLIVMLKRFHKSILKQNRKRTEKCKSCRSTQHGSESCRFKNATCHHCQKKGHILPMCKARFSQMQFKGRSSGKKISKVNSCDSISDDESVGSCDKHARHT